MKKDNIYTQETKWVTFINGIFQDYYLSYRSYQEADRHQGSLDYYLKRRVAHWEEVIIALTEASAQTISNKKMKSNSQILEVSL